MIILGIDPGTARTGFGVVQKEQGSALRCLAFGCIETPKEDKPEHRLLLLEKEVQKLLRKYRPDLVGIEKLFFARNVSTALPVSEARGVVLVSASRAGVPVMEFTPLQVKMAIGGYGRAEKRQVQRMVKEILGLALIPEPDDAADALGVAIACSLGAKAVPMVDKPTPLD
ncbi:MAG: crossover junction endodeoxyribonuclease RuvC [Candidatus Yanofskybacteria bacterium]|nr:crossover junction endodeoxyribonuclease RuvC [Candidatus Yanofskybacteria bacterium]